MLIITLNIYILHVCLQEVGGYSKLAGIQELHATRVRGLPRQDRLAVAALVEVRFQDLAHTLGAQHPAVLLRGLRGGRQ